MRIGGNASDQRLAKEKLKFWQTELFASCTRGDLKAIVKLLDDGCPIDLMDPKSEVADTPLLWACRTNAVELVDLCLNRGAKFDPHPDFGETALQIAVTNRQIGAAQLLLRTAEESRADRFIVNLEDHNKDAPLHVAARNADMDSVELLLHHQADCRCVTLAFCLFCFVCLLSLLLLCACVFANSAMIIPWCVGLFFFLGLSFFVFCSLLNGQGRTPLHSAATHGAKRVVSRLLEAGAAVVIDLQDYDGYTALHCAAQCGSPPIVRVLLEAGANIHLTTSSMKSATVVAQENGHSITSGSFVDIIQC